MSVGPFTLRKPDSNLLYYLFSSEMLVLPNFLFWCLVLHSVSDAFSRVVPSIDSTPPSFHRIGSSNWEKLKGFVEFKAMLLLKAQKDAVLGCRPLQGASDLVSCA